MKKERPLLNRIVQEGPFAIKKEKKMKRAVIFDLDGVLIDSEGIYFTWTKEFFEENGILISREDILSLAGSSEKFSDQKIYEWWEAAKHDGKSRKAVLSLYNAYCEAQPFSYAEIINPGAREVLQYLKKNEIKTAVASSSPMHAIRNALEETGLMQYFDTFVSGNMFPESKPDPEIYLYTMRQLGLSGESCIAVEDSEYGVRAGKRAGMTVIAKRDPKFDFDLSEADYRIDHLIESLEIIKRI